MEGLQRYIGCAPRRFDCRVHAWLDGLPEGMLGDATRRNLQVGITPKQLVRSVVKAVTCTISSIFVDNILYSQVEDLDDYDDNPGTGLKTVEVVSENPKGKEFLYHDTFWLNYPGFCSLMVSFAETEEQFPLSTGQLRQPGTPLFLGLGSDDCAYNIRVSGASNWEFAEGSFCYPAVKFLDLVYGFKPKNGSLTDPREFTIVPSIKIPFTDFRVGLDSDCTVDITGRGGFGILRFDMKLVDVCRNIKGAKGAVRGYEWRKTWEACKSGAKIWQRDIYWLQSLNVPPKFRYYVIQIVDGNGEKTGAYNKFAKNQRNGGYPINEFRSLKSSKRSKCR